MIPHTSSWDVSKGCNDEPMMQSLKYCWTLFSTHPIVPTRAHLIPNPTQTHTLNLSLILTLGGNCPGGNCPDTAMDVPPPETAQDDAEDEGSQEEEEGEDQDGRLQKIQASTATSSKQRLENDRNESVNERNAHKMHLPWVVRIYFCTVWFSPHLY